MSDDDDIFMMTWSYSRRNEFVLFSTFNYCHRYTCVKTTVFYINIFPLRQLLPLLQRLGAV